MNIIMWLVKVMTMRVYECSNVLSSPGHPPGGLVFTCVASSMSEVRIAGVAAFTEVWTTSGGPWGLAGSTSRSRGMSRTVG